MQSTHIVLLQSDPRVTQALSARLSSSFHGVHVARTVEDLRHVAAKHRPETIIVDLEAATLSDVEILKQEFRGVRIVCNHRVADEEMWTRTLVAGADDFCPSDDVCAILSAATPEPNKARVMVA
jgi:DNA-binding NarL/FixJ family response regulator